ncbi:SH3 domain-containing protein [Pseudomonas kitaguniensis]|nr:SH3 domain-containing protein [Pseudomonas kitaguniensis]
MRKKSESWFVPLLILFAVLWAIGKKDTPPTQVPPNVLNTPTSLASVAPTPPAPPPPIEQYVSTDTLNVRNQPDGRVITKLKRGTKVQVYEKANDWARISIDGQPAKWLSSKSLCGGSNCYVKSQPKPIRPAPRPEYRPATEYSSSCPCSSGNVCIGPRGGRYCITSGGNKRYGV